MVNGELAEAFSILDFILVVSVFVVMHYCEVKKAMSRVCIGSHFMEEVFVGRTGM